MFTPKPVTEIRDRSTELEVASGLLTIQGLAWGQMNPSRENPGTMSREEEIGSGKESRHIWGKAPQVADSEHSSRCIDFSLPICPLSSFSQYPALGKIHQLIFHTYVGIYWLITNNSNLTYMFGSDGLYKSSRTRLDAWRNKVIREYVSATHFSHLYKHREDAQNTTVYLEYNLKNIYYHAYVLICKFENYNLTALRKPWHPPACHLHIFLIKIHVLSRLYTYLEEWHVCYCFISSRVQQKTWCREGPKYLLVK